MTTITYKPILPVMTITKNDNSNYTFNSFTGTFDFRLQQLQVKPPVDSRGGTFTMKLVSSDASNTNANTFLNNIECGNTISVSLGKSNTSLTKVLLGVIEDIMISEPNKNLMNFTITGTDWGSFILKNRIINWAWYQRKAADGISLDKTDTTTSVSNLAKDMITDITKVYPFNDFAASDQGVVFNTANIDPLVGNVQLPQFLANFEHLDDKLSELDQWGAGFHYVDPNKNFYIKPIKTPPDPSQAWLFVDDPNDSDIANWPSGKVGFLSPNTQYEYTIENYKRRVIGIGGDKLQIDPQIDQETNNGSDVLHTGGNNQWLAVQFVPRYVTATTIFVWVSQVGIPQINLLAQLVMDNNNSPTGQVIRQLSKSYTDISVDPGNWVSFQIGDEYLVGNKYWFVLAGTGSDSNTFRWYKGTGLASSPAYQTATSTDGITWSAASANSGYLIRSYYSTPLITALPGAGVSATDKGMKEEIYRKPFIYDVNSMNSYLQTLTSVTNFKKEILSGRVYAPDTIPVPFNTVVIKKTLSGLPLTGTSNYYILTDITYNFRGGEQGATGEFYLDFSAVRFTSYP